MGSEPFRKERSAEEAGHLIVLLLGLAPGGVCRASDVTTRAVVSYTAVSPLLRLTSAPVGAVCSLLHFP